MKYKDEIKLFREVTDIMKTITYRFTAAVLEEYLDYLRNRGSNSITEGIQEILEYLFGNDGVVE